MEHREQTAYFLVGPTATGKTSVAQHIAEQESCRVVSADSMLVYRGMDIGTAKPAPEALSRVTHYGIDITTPDHVSHVEAWLQAVTPAFAGDVAAESLLVTGGTGLYLRCLVEGLNTGAAPDCLKREHWEDLLEEKGVEALQGELQAADPERYEALADKQNPRRLIRALESAGDQVAERDWAQTPQHVPFAGLDMDPELLNSRIESRVRDMYRRGLVEEVQQLMDRYPSWSDTARQAIGYSEAVQHMAGDLDLEEAVDRTTIRTRQLAKRQRTWFRNQANVEWITVEADMEVDDIARAVMRVWEEHGPTPVSV